jgi:hypothetical protein
MKSGTHLMQELMVALGYGMYGQTRITPEIRPLLDTDVRWRVAAQVYDENQLAELKNADEPQFLESTDRAWSALAWAWQMKFGMPLVNRYGRAVVESELVEQARRRTLTAPFADTPPGVCWIFTEFDIARIDGHFLEEWMQTGEPRIIFNYRDPRDVVVSMVNFLSGNTARGYGDFNEFPVFNRILTAKESFGDRLSYALTDPSFPGHRAYENALWLLNHPNVCKVSFEQLVGPQGGGSTETQRDAVRRVVEFLELDADPAAVSARLFRRDAFSFFKGQIGAWREVFTAEHTELFRQRSGRVLPLYGYE